MAATKAPYLPVNPEIRYEHTDINPRGVAITGVGILLATWFFVSLLYFYYAVLARHRAETTPHGSVRAAGQVFQPPEPRLEVSSHRDLTALRASEEIQLNGYYWLDQQQGTVTMPIERAMELIAQKGIPPQKAPADLKLPIPLAGSRRTGLEGKVEPEAR